MNEVRPGWAVFALLIAMACLVACGSITSRLRSRIDRGRYDEAVAQGRQWLDENPDGDHGTQRDVRLLLAEARLQQAVRSGTTSAYRDFAAEHRDRGLYARLLDQARRYESQAFFRETVTREESPAPCRTYRTRYPDGPDMPEVRQREVSLAFGEATARDDLGLFLTFVATYADWPEAAELLPHARRHTSELALQALSAAPSLAACREFRGRYGPWEEAEAALEVALGLEADLAWIEAKRQHNYQAYHDYLERYPNSRHYLDAELRASELWGFHGPRGVDELTATVTSVDASRRERVEVYVQVMEDDNEPVGGLCAPLFDVYENGHRVDIVEFQGMDVSRPADIVFVFDTTGSMHREIDGVKRAAIRFAEALRMRNRDIRLGMVTFGDEVRGVHPKRGKLTSSVGTFRRWVAAQRAEGGGDGPENPVDAFFAALGMRFRKEAQVVFVLITDAPAHERDRVTRRTLADAAGAMAARSVSLFVVAPRIAQFAAMTDFLNGQLLPLARESDFSDFIMRVSRMTAKQYRIVYRSFVAEGARRVVRVRAHRDNVWMPAAGVPGGRVNALAADPGEATRFVAATPEGLYVTPDAGGQWHRVGAELPDASFVAILPSSSDGTQLIARSATGRLYVSPDHGATWQATGGDGGPTTSLAQDLTRPHVVYATDGAVVHRSTDGGVTWTRRGAPHDRPGPASLVVDPNDGDDLWFIAETSSLASKDGGATWEPLTLTPPRPDLSLEDLRLYRHPMWKGLTFAISPDGKVYRSANRGRKWRLVYDDAAAPARDMAFETTIRRWIVLTTEGSVMASRNGGQAWFSLAGCRDRGGADPTVAAVGASGVVLLASATDGGAFHLSPVVDREFIAGSVYFAYDSAKIHRRLHGYLDDLAALLQRRPHVRVRAEGHTDDVGPDDYNQQLSERRAVAIRDYLTARGVSGHRILAFGYGETRPLVPNRSAGARARNRRVELTLLGRGRPLPAYVGSCP